MVRQDRFLDLEDPTQVIPRDLVMATGKTIDGVDIDVRNTDLATLEARSLNLLYGVVPVTADWGDIPIEFVYLDDGGVFTDRTSQANSATANDVSLFPTVAALNDAFYFGKTAQKFDHITFEIGTAGTVGTMVWEYYNGTAWTTLTLLSGGSTLGTIGAGAITFTPPADWALATVDSQEAMWIRGRCLTTYTQSPLATQIWMDGAPDNDANSTDGDVATATGIGQTVKGEAGNSGSWTFDLGSIKTLMVCAKLGMASTAGTMTAYIEGSLDDQTYLQGPSPARTVTSASIVAGNTTMLFMTARYIKVYGALSEAGTISMEIYELKAYELVGGAAT